MELTAIASWLNTAFAGFDQSAAIAIHRLFETAPGFFTPFLTIISYLGKGGAFLILLSIVLMLFRPTRRYGTTMLLALAIGALITNIIVKPLVARPRPYIWEGSVYQQFWIELGKFTESDKSFPSGHMTAAMAASTAVFLRGDRRISWTAFFFAVAMGISRIYLSVHYASDVIGGILTGGVGGILGYIISLRIGDAFYNGDIRELKSIKLSSLKPTVSPAGKHEAARRSAERPPRREIVLDGENFSDLDGFYDEIGRAFELDDDSSVRNMDALNDLLRGGTDGDPSSCALLIHWRNSAKSEKDLGWEETIRYYEAAMERVHPDNRGQIERKLIAAKAGKGLTLYEQLIALFQRMDTGHDCTVLQE